MTYQPLQIANFSTSLYTKLQPWLIPDDAQYELFDGFVYKGVMGKRSGYAYYANGERGSNTYYSESRIVNTITSEPALDSLGAAVVGNGTAGPYTIVLKNANVRRGTFSITDTGQTVADNGVGGFTTGSGTINYQTGAVTITFASMVTASQRLFITYDYHPGLPVMGVMNYITTSNTKRLVVADTKVLNIYTSSTNILEYLGNVKTITGISKAAPGVVTTSAAHNLTTGDKVLLYGVLGMEEVNNVEYVVTYVSGTTFSIGVDTSGGGYTAYTSGGTVKPVFTGAKTNFMSWVNYEDKLGVRRLLYTNNKDEIGYYAPDSAVTVGNYINYPTLATTYFAMNDDAGAAITTLTCLLIFTLKDRLIMLRTTESGVVKPRRIRISGTGASSDDFTTTATGAGKIDVPGGFWITGATLLKDELIIFTEQETWVLQYTNNDTVPFTLKKIDSSRGSKAPFSAFTYLGRSTADSPEGLISTDGYRVNRRDENNPDLCFNEIDGENFDLCFSGAVDEDHDHYLLYPPQGQTDATTKSLRIIAENYDEGDIAIYRQPLSCMGRFLVSYEITWADLAKYNTWQEMANDFKDWNAFIYSKGSPFSVGGGHNGEIWKLNNNSEDNPVRVWNITVIDASTLEITTDWNNFSTHAQGSEFEDDSLGFDTIFFQGIAGMVEINHKQYAITSVTDNYTFRVNVPENTANFTAFATSAYGSASRVIPFTALTKNFNPFTDQYKKIRMGWISMYVSSSDTSLKRNIAITGATKANPCVITTSVAHNLTTGNQITIFGVGGMTEINNLSFGITVLTSTTFTLNGINSTAYTTYTSGGYATITELAKLDLEIYTNDEGDATNKSTSNKYQGRVSKLSFEKGVKKWYKVFINQVGKFIQIRLSNMQAGAAINVHAMTLGVEAIGRTI